MTIATACHLESAWLWRCGQRPRHLYQWHRNRRDHRPLLDSRWTGAAPDPSRPILLSLPLQRRRLRVFELKPIRRCSWPGARALRLGHDLFLGPFGTRAGRNHHSVGYGVVSETTPSSGHPAPPCQSQRLAADDLRASMEKMPERSGPMTGSWHLAPADVCDGISAGSSGGGSAG